ncbi:hypothetical protein SS1G_14067 [Sclerotinia sclerotiorum 1980 UF-70]|uniref:Uncharacterized protein n=1 Tax=Sclerotinia sclerotiorum (strain ATCC 18683 / 1980 / Ss-1) TaxID=665079 RepID=A7F8Y6_SCLS1|nr:hypothetical protein SS1G_14067 [Sclerotinia sclerotiorum 1980 UF-70]EDN99207.1 hypothetical protein SS1G_14067 [Sclerotinia sclerotiorum 1980 UF-70]
MSNSPNSPTVRLQEDHEGLQVVPDDDCNARSEESPMDKDIKFQPYSAGAAYGGTLNVSEPGYNVPLGLESPPPAFHLINEYKISNNNTLTYRRFTTSRKPQTETSSTSSSTGTTISSAAPSTTSPVGQTCVNGTGPGNYLGLCNFSCNFGYCPSPCTCLQFSTTAIPAPPITNTPGFPLPGENADYTGLCSFTCNHGYCPEGACTTDSSAAGGRNSSVTTAAAVVSTPSSGSSSLPGSSVELLTLTPPTSTVVVTLLGSVTSTVVVGPSSTG